MADEHPFLDLLLCQTDAHRKAIDVTSYHQSNGSWWTWNMLWLLPAFGHHSRLSRKMGPFDSLWVWMSKSNHTILDFVEQEHKITMSHINLQLMCLMQKEYDQQLEAAYKYQLVWVPGTQERVSEKGGLERGRPPSTLVLVLRPVILWYGNGLL
jgi:hypothetical protein